VRQEVCGIAGFVDFKPAAEADLLTRAQAMAESLLHRGPDRGGCWADPGAGFATGHRRLSIVDLSEAGAQPMVSQSGRFVISYNGEFYNAGDIRPELEAKGYVFRGHSDTEVLLEACAEWGIHETLQRVTGMFAFALWDRQARRLWLARDRLGIKPLYWALFGQLLLFGSELKALLAHPLCSAEINRDAVAAFVRFNYIPTPHSIYRNVLKLPPGAVLEIDARRKPHIDRYWALDQVIQRAQSEPFDGSEAEAEEALASTLGDAVGRRMIADVPIGAFLSGGIDSSAVVSLMQSRSSRPVRTFSIGFQDAEYNEAHHAKAVAHHLGTDHTELYVTHDEARDVIPRLTEFFDEPFADPSQIPTYIVSALARRSVTVALSGDGGDEVFCGYSRYLHALWLNRYLSVLSWPIRSVLAGTIRRAPPAGWNRAQRFLPTPLRHSRFGERLHKLASILLYDEKELYLQLLSQFSEPDQIVNGSHEPPVAAELERAKHFIPDFLERMQYFDTLTYLPDDILTKVDRASMAVSLEVRVPMIDHRVIELAWRFPRDMRYRNGETKRVLRRLLRRFVPAGLIERPKMGFGVPIGKWLRGPLRDWAEDLLSESALTKDGMFNPKPIRARWKAHLEGHEDWQYALWTIITVQDWLSRRGAGSFGVR
jgi:asparagine synthase (glutamine-hydrolysing)